MYGVLLYCSFPHSSMAVRTAPVPVVLNRVHPLSLILTVLGGAFGCRGSLRPWGARVDPYPQGLKGRARLAAPPQDGAAVKGSGNPRFPLAREGEASADVR